MKIKTLLVLLATLMVGIAGAHAQPDPFHHPQLDVTDPASFKRFKQVLTTRIEALHNFGNNGARRVRGHQQQIEELFEHAYNRLGANQTRLNSYMLR